MNKLLDIKKKIPNNVLIVVAGKNRTVEELEEVIKTGAAIIGENRAQELLEKYPRLKDKAAFHFIGHLQTNKVKDIINKVELIHSVDNFKLARIINKYANHPKKVLVEINTTGEKNKYGVNPEKLSAFIKKTGKFTNIKIVGLMTMGKLTQNPERNRKYFKTLANLAKENNLEYLSMGTSQDYQVAIQEGANIIRLGKIIFES